MQKFVRCLLLTGSTAGAEQVAREALDSAQRLAAAHPNTATLETDVALTHLGLGNVLGGSGSSSGSRQLGEAIRHDQQAIEIASRYARGGDPALTSQIAAMKLSLGFHLGKQRRFEEADRALEQAVALEQGLSPKSRPELVRYWTYYGLMLERQDQQRRALDAYRRALPIALEGAPGRSDSTPLAWMLRSQKGMSPCRWRAWDSQR